MNTAEFLDIASAICPDRQCIVFANQRWTYLQTLARVNKLANALDKFGVEKGDRIGMIQVNCSQYIESYFASAKLGCIFIPLNYRAKADELGYMIAQAEAKLLFVGRRYMDMINSLLPNLPAVKKCIPIDIDGGQKDEYETILQSASSEEVIREIGDEDTTILMFTAGTTGRPKGVPLKHSAFVTYALENVEPANPDIEEKNLLAVPLYHVAGMQAMVAGIYGGRTLVLMRQFEVKDWLETVQREQATRVMLVPTMLKRVIDDPDFQRYNLKSLKIMTYGAAPMPLEVIQKAIRLMPWVQFINAFGQTETASTIAVLGPEDHRIEGTEEEKEKKLKRLASSIGKPLRDVEVKIVDEEGKKPPPLEVGEIWARGSRIMTGYWRDEERTSLVLTSDGWLRTGDMGWMDDEGYIYLAGRADDMIIRGGENISPEEVEDVLYSHPMIEEAAVIGIAHPEWGQEPRAIIVLKHGQTATPEEIIEYCRSRLAGFKRPRSVIFVDSLPRNPMGKVIKKILREEHGQP
jgi:acyl-CoA synthetase (AMP-forming)/AMP-acid ligase II